MRAVLIAALVALGGPAALAQSTPRQDAMIGSYFAIWDQDSHVTPENVQKFYASRLIYYGHPMTRQGLLRDKQNFIRRWPERRYDVEPGSASKQCDAAEDHCRFVATLVWRTAGPSGTRSGRSRVTLTLEREDGALKIVREGGVTLTR